MVRYHCSGLRKSTLGQKLPDILMMNTSYSLMSILNARLLLFCVALPQAYLIATRHVSDVKM